MKKRLETLGVELFKTLDAIQSHEELEAVELQYLGRKGEFTSLLRQLGELSPEMKKEVGQMANELKKEAEKKIQALRVRLDEERLRAIGKTDRLDVTEPGIRPAEGHVHLVTQAMREIMDIFHRIGFVRVQNPEVDWDWYAFESLNMPKDHPARDEWETFFIDVPESENGKMVLTPHTSNAQVRELKRGEFPVRMINIAKCYRRQIDATHVPMFHQFEGLYVDKHVSIAHLRGVLDFFARSYFGQDRVTRLRPFHFRFTEPSFEIDISCGVCGGAGEFEDGTQCRACKRGWVELGGAGMVHPNVLKSAGIDPKEYSGFAFGWGVERTAMMKSGTKLDDIRILYKNDLRFLKQF